MSEYSREEANRLADEAIKAVSKFIVYISPYLYKQQSDLVNEIGRDISELKRFIHLERWKLSENK